VALDPLVQADQLGWPLRLESGAAAEALIGTMIDHVISSVAQAPAMALMVRLGPAGFELLPLLLAIRRGRLGRRARVGRRARGLVRPLQAQHQLNQLRLAATLKLATTHPQP
jgi:hypothetical protein